MDLNQNRNGLIVSTNIMYEDRSFLYFYKNNIKVKVIYRDSSDYIYVQLNSGNEGFTLNRCDLDLKK